MYKNIGTGTRSAGMQVVVVTGTKLTGTGQFPSAASYVRNLFFFKKKKKHFCEKATKMSPLVLSAEGSGAHGEV